ncbi:MAG: hypothetical protein WB761_33885 [Solirubrobacteraceae bacterium]
MAVRERTDVELSGELEEIATRAAERLRALTDGDVEREADLQRRVGEAASRAIAAGLLLSAIADAERIGQGRAREELGPDLLRRVERAARRKREAEHEYEQVVVRAARLGLAHRDVAAAAQVAHGTVRAITARTHTVSGRPAASTSAAVGAESEQRSANAPELVDVAAEPT